MPHMSPKLRYVFRIGVKFSCDTTHAGIDIPIDFHPQEKMIPITPDIVYGCHTLFLFAGVSLRAIQHDRQKISANAKNFLGQDKRFRKSVCSCN